MKFSVIIPTLNEAQTIGNTLEALARVTGDIEIVVVDGGSDDGTCDIVNEYKARLGLRLLDSARGRGAQMHAGACAAQGEVLWFLHADTLPPVDALENIAAALHEIRVVGGNFTIKFDGTQHAAQFLTWLYPQLRKIGLCYGDSAIFVRRDIYEQTGGFQPFPIFEDLDLLRRIRKKGRMVNLASEVVTSSRRFEERSFTLTFARWAILQGFYWLGVHPRTLVRYYAHIRGTRK